MEWSDHRSDRTVSVIIVISFALPMVGDLWMKINVSFVVISLTRATPAVGSHLLIQELQEQRPLAQHRGLPIHVYP
jgi:hypothetical protein